MLSRRKKEKKIAKKIISDIQKSAPLS